MKFEVPLLSYFQKNNEYSAALQGMRYFFRPYKEALLDAEGNAVLDEKGKEKTKSMLEAVIWPEPWAMNRTDPALRQATQYPLNEAGRTAAIAWLEERYEAEFDRWQEIPSILDSEPWYPAPVEE